VVGPAAPDKEGFGVAADVGADRLVLRGVTAQNRRDTRRHRSLLRACGAPRYGERPPDTKELSCLTVLSSR
jgi:hypothetical protein